MRLLYLYLVPGTYFFDMPQTAPKLQNPRYFTFLMSHHRNSGRRGSFSPSAGPHFHTIPNLVMASVGRAGWCRMAVTRSRVTWQTGSLPYNVRVVLSCQLLNHPSSCLRSGWKLTRWTVYNSRNLVFNLWSLLDRFSRFGAFFSVPPVCWAHLKLCAASKLSQQCFVEKVRLDILHMFL